MQLHIDGGCPTFSKRLIQKLANTSCSYYVILSESNNQDNNTKPILSAQDNVLVAGSIVQKDVYVEAPPVLTLRPAVGMDLMEEEEESVPVPDFQAKNVVSKLPFHCDFGKALLPLETCGFSNAENDDFDWKANVYDTPTARTGPPVVRFEKQCKKPNNHSCPPLVATTPL